MVIILGKYNSLFEEIKDYISDPQMIDYVLELFVTTQIN